MQDERYSRQGLIQWWSQERLRVARVLIDRGPFDYSADRPEIMARGREGSAAFWRLDGKRHVHTEPIEPRPQAAATTADTHLRLIVETLFRSS